MQHNMEVQERNDVDEAGTIRVFVGGLGEGVTVEDIQKTFSSLGMVKDVDIVRTKGRSFAYMEFCPSSDHALSKLFSMYNGCVWKGGRLKLEKAKEHYMVRLKREWAEDEKLPSLTTNNEVDEDKKMDPLMKPERFQKKETKVIHMFFPKSRKIKALPLSGTGKHKYSFQRIEVPALPVHFCDCEEHFDPSYAATGKNFHNLERQNGGMNEEEVNLMNSVMNKLFEKENNVKAAASDGTEWAEQVDYPIESHDDLPLDENEAWHSEEDNLIINIVAGGNGIMALNDYKQETFSIKQKSRSSERQNSKDKGIKNSGSSEERRVAPPKKKRKLHPNEVSDDYGIVFPMPETKGKLQSTEQKSGVLQSGTSLSLSKKSSWKKLIDSSETNQFSISSMLQASSPSDVKEQELGNLDVPNATECETSNGESASTKDEEQELSSVDVPNATDSDITGAMEHEPVEDQPGEKMELEDAQSTKPNGVVVSRSARGASWKHKSSWTQLISDPSSSSFSISKIVTGVDAEKEELPKPNNGDVMKCGDKKQCHLKQNRSELAGDWPRAFGLDRDGSTAVSRSSNTVHLDEKARDLHGLGGSRSTPEKVKHSIKGRDGASTSKVTKGPVAAAKQASAVDGGAGETCLFMKSDASMKEWASIKAALSGSLKKKNTGK